MIGIKILALGIFWGAVAISQTVKVVTKDVSGEAAQSGWAFRVGEKSFVVSALRPTSESKSTDAVVLEKGKITSAKRLVSDWGRGLVLYEVSDPTEVWKEMGKASTLPPVFSLEGYAVGSTKPLTLLGAKLLAARSSRHHFPLAAQISEVAVTVAPAGFSGAPAYDAQRELVGLLSSQYLRMVPGRATRPLHWRIDNLENQNHLLMIPAESVMVWVRQFLDGKLDLAFVDAARNEKTQDESISVGGISFRQLSPKPSATGVLSGDFPVGSGDGVGVGGGDRLELASKAYATKASSLAPFPFSHLTHWNKELLALVVKGEEVEISFLLRRNPVTERLEYKSFHSLPEMFRLMATKQGEPLLIRKTPPSAKADLARAAGSLAELVSNYRQWSSFWDDSDSIALLKEIYLVAKVLQSEKSNSVSLAQVDGLGDRNGSHRRGWALLTHWPSRGQALIERFQALRERLAKLPNQ